MPAPKSVRRAARQGGNIKSPRGSKPEVKVPEVKVPEVKVPEVKVPEATAKVSEPDAEGLQEKLESLVNQHGIAEILSALGEISRRSDHARKQD
jgi:hypothetical protein